MDAAFAWLGQLAEWLGAFIPRWVILDTTQGAIKYVGGDRPVVCGPGVHFFWPARTTFVIYPTARQTDQLETQTMESSDGVTFVVSGLITYRVIDLAALLTTTHDAMVAIRDMAQAAVHDVCCAGTWTELQGKQRNRSVLKTELKNEAQRQLKDYGVEVIKLQLTSLARCRVIRLSQSTAQEG